MDGDADDVPGEEAEELEPGVLVPVDAVVRIDGRRGVFVLERDVARFRAVELGGESSGRVLVHSGVELGELVVSAPPATLADGDRVRRDG